MPRSESNDSTHPQKQQKKAKGATPKAERPTPNAQGKKDGVDEKAPADRKTKKGKKKCPRRGASEQAAINRRQAIDLRLQGATYQRIADRLNVSVKTAFQYVDEAMKELQEATKADTEKLRTMELRHLDQLEERWLPLALHESLDVSKVVMGSGEDAKPVHIELDAWDAGMKAVDRVLKIKERRAKLLGLEAPQKHEHSGHLTLDDFETRMQEAVA